MLNNPLIIHNPDRLDRMENIKTQLEYFYKSNYTYQIFPAMFAKPISGGIAAAHMNVVSYAKLVSRPRVLIMEDDVKFTSDRAKDHFYCCMENTPEDADVLLCGISWCKKKEDTNPFWDKVIDFSGLQMYIVNEKAYERILAFDKNSHIDRAMSTTLGLNCYVVKRMFAIQQSGYSDNLKRTVDYTSRWNQFKLLE